MTAKLSLCLLLLLALLVAGCGPAPTPETVIQTVEVEKTVVETVEVEVEKTVVETVEVEVEKSVIETVEVEVEVPVVETVVVEIEAEEPMQLSFAGHQYFNLSFGPAPAPLEAMRAEAAEVYPNVDIQLIMQPLDANKWHDNLTTYFVAEDPTVDLLYLAGYWVTEFGSADWLTPLDDIVDPELLAKFDPAFLEPFRHEGKLLGIGPSWGGIGGLYYRTDLLEEYGIEPPETYDDIIAACDTILADNPDLGCWDWPAMRNVVLVNRWSEYLHGFGGTYLNEHFCRA